MMFRLTYVYTSLALVAGLTLLSSYLSSGTGSGYGWFAAMLFLVVALVTLALKAGLHSFVRLGLVSPMIIIGGTVVWYLYPAVFTAAVGEWCPEGMPSCISADVALRTLALIGLFCAFFLATYSFRGIHTASTVRPPSQSWFPSVASFGVLLALVGVLPILFSPASWARILEAILYSRAEQKPWVYTGNFSTEEGFWLAFARAALIAALSLILYATLNLGQKRMLRVWLFTLFLMLFVLQALDTGTRALSVLIVLPPVICWFLKQPPAVRPKKVTTMIVVALAVVALTQAQLVLREDWSKIELDEAFMRRIWLLGDTIDFFRESAFAVTLVPNSYSYFFEFDPLLFASYPVPRFIWPDKPFSEIGRIYTFERWGVDIFLVDGNVFPGAIGQYYMSFGIMGPIVLGMLAGFFARLIDVKTQRASEIGSLRMLAYMSYAIGIFLSFRFVSPGNFLPGLIIHAVAITLEKYQSRARV